MATDPQSIQNVITVGGVLAIGAFLTLFEKRTEKIISDFLNRPERIAREKALIAEETKGLACKERAEETRGWVRGILKACKHCPQPDLTSTDAIRRDAA